MVLSGVARVTDLGPEVGDEDLFRAYAEADPQARERLTEVIVERYSGLVRWLASRYAGRGVDGDELRQVGFVGLMKAINRFDPDRGVEFASFARPTVQGEIQRHFRDKRRWIRLPRRLQEMKAVLREATETLTHQLGRAPTVAELATHLAVDEELVIEALTADDTFNPVSLDAFGSDEEGEDNRSPLDALGELDPRLDLMIDTETLRPLLAALPDRERMIIQLRFFGECTQSEIAGRLGISQMHVSRLLSKTLRTLREQMCPTT
jgi:RNA polymerase sigma-B factor